MSDLVIRQGLQPGDLGSVVHLHGVLYARELGWDVTFEAYVAGPLAEFALLHGERERIWLAEQGGHLVGSIAVVRADADRAQLRWLLVDPGTRGAGLGRRLLGEAIEFARSAGYHSLFLWTERRLEAAARLYRAAGFRLTEEKAHRFWGDDVVEQRYDLDL